MVALQKESVTNWRDVIILYRMSTSRFAKTMFMWQVYMSSDIKERYKKSLKMLEDIMAPMNDTAMLQAQYRCPYRNKDDRCTAKFGCRNQRNPKVNDMLGCDQKNNDNLNYKSYWEMVVEEAELGRQKKEAIQEDR